ncbi:hypothetical protein [Aquipluma nitroreducens]|nr:hypothetical protein [Aquipluma nitroreducens]
MKKQETYAVRFVLRNSKVAQNEKSSLSVRVTVNAQSVIFGQTDHPVPI